MASGIYVLGQSKDVEPAFDNYINPQLIERGVVVLHRSLVPLDIHKKGLLVSLTGESLEEMLSQGIVSAFDIVRQKQEKLIQVQDRESYWEYTLNLVKSEYAPDSGPFKGKKEKIWHAVYTRISSYADSESATREFPLRVQEYLLERLSVLAEQVGGEIQELLGRKLSDFAK